MGVFEIKFKSKEEKVIRMIILESPEKWNNYFEVSLNGGKVWLPNSMTDGWFSPFYPSFFRQGRPLTIISGTSKGSTRISINDVNAEYLKRKSQTSPLGSRKDELIDEASGGMLFFLSHSPLPFFFLPRLIHSFLCFFCEHLPSNLLPFLYPRAFYLFYASGEFIHPSQCSQNTKMEKQIVTRSASLDPFVEATKKPGFLEAEARHHRRRSNSIGTKPVQDILHLEDDLSLPSPPS